MDIETKREKIGKLLMEAFDLSLETGDIYKIGKLIEDAVNRLSIWKRCTVCGRAMKFFDFCLKQGVCDKCAEELSHDVEV